MYLFKLNESCLHIYSEAKLIKVSHYYFVVDYSLIWILKTCTRTAAHLSLGLGRRYFLQYKYGNIAQRDAPTVLRTLFSPVAIGSASTILTSAGEGL